ETEHPGRFLVLDTDRLAAFLIGAVAGMDGPRVALRDGRSCGPRLAEAGPEQAAIHVPHRRPDCGREVRQPGTVAGLARGPARTRPSPSPPLPPPNSPAPRPPTSYASRPARPGPPFVTS